MAKNKLRMHSAEICVMPEGGQTQIERPDTETDGNCEMKLSSLTSFGYWPGS